MKYKTNFLLLYSLKIYFFILNSIQNHIARTQSEVYDSLKIKERTHINFNEIEKLDKNQIRDELDEMKYKLSKLLDFDIHSFNDDFWKKLHNYIILNWKELNINGSLAINFEIRYFMCVYIILFIPEEIGFFIPARYKMIIPKKLYKIPIVKDILNEMDLFLKYIKIKSKGKLLITAYFGKRNCLKSDLNFLLNLKDRIINEPLSVIRDILSFEIWTDGYDEFKKTNKK